MAICVVDASAYMMDFEKLGTNMGELLLRIDPGQVQEIAQSVQVIEECLENFPFNEIAISFNGGKDCTVVLHLLDLVLRRKFPNDPERTLAKLKVVYFEKDDDFPEMIEFSKNMSVLYGFVIGTYPGDYKKGLQILENQGTKAILMGQRKTDPYGATLEHFTPCTKGWPNIIRVNPILDWSYRTIWAFLRILHLPYCKLYDEGYTSLGSVSTTTKHPALLSTDGVARPAHELANGDELERTNRLP